jgi:hypothetical protein
MQLLPKSDHPGYSYEKTHWVFVTGVEPLNCCPANYLSGFRRDAMQTTFSNRRLCGGRYASAWVLQSKSYRPGDSRLFWDSDYAISRHDGSVYPSDWQIRGQAGRFGRSTG